MFAVGEILKVYRKALFAGTLVFCLAGLLVGLLGAGSRYEATVVLMITGSEEKEKKVDYMTILANQRLAKTLTEVAQSPAVLAETAEKMGWRGSVAELRQRVRVRQKGDTELMEVTAVADRPGQAGRLADYLTDAFGQYAEKKLGIRVKTVNPPDEYRISSGEKVAVGGILGLVAGFTLVFGAALLREHLRQPVRRREDLTHLALPVWGPVLLNGKKEDITGGGGAESGEENPAVTGLWLQKTARARGLAGKELVITGNLAREEMEEVGRLLCEGMSYLREPGLEDGLTLTVAPPLGESEGLLAAVRAGAVLLLARIGTPAARVKEMVEKVRALNGEIVALLLVAGRKRKKRWRRR